MTRASMLALLRSVEMMGETIDDQPCCPSCFTECLTGPGPQPHHADCKLAAAISWLEDENNSEVHYEYDDKPATRMWVLR